MAKLKKNTIGTHKLPSIMVITLGWVIYMTGVWLINMAPKISIWHSPPDLPFHQSVVQVVHLRPPGGRFEDKLHELPVVALILLSWGND